MKESFSIDDSNPLIKYGPQEVWHISISTQDDLSAVGKYTQDSKTWTNTAGAHANLTFYGSSLVIRGAKRWNHGTYTVVLDGKRYENLNGTAAYPGEFHAVLFAVREGEIEEGKHEVMIINTPREGDAGSFLDLDFIEWNSTSTVHSSKDVLQPDVFMDSSNAFSWEPKGAWRALAPKVNEDAQGHSPSHHITSAKGAAVNFTFTGAAISVFGTTGPHSSTYSVWLDDTYVDTFNSSRPGLPAPRRNTMLFQTSNIPGEEDQEHILRIQKEDNEDGEEGDRPQLVIEGAQVIPNVALQADKSRSITATGAIPTATGNGTSERKGGVSPAALGGIIGGLLGLALILLLVAFFLNRRNKQLWHKIASGDDEYSPDVKTPFRTNSSGSTSLDPVRNASGHGVSKESSSGTGYTYVANDLGYSYPWSPKNKRERNVTTETATTDTSYQPLYDPPPLPVNRAKSKHYLFGTRNPPTRAGTAETTSTLVAEHGSAWSPTEENALKEPTNKLQLVPRWGFLGRIRDTRPPPPATPPSIPLPPVPRIDEVKEPSSPPQIAPIEVPSPRLNIIIPSLPTVTSSPPRPPLIPPAPQQQSRTLPPPPIHPAVPPPYLPPTSEEYAQMLRADLVQRYRQSSAELDIDLLRQDLDGLTRSPTATTATSGSVGVISGVWVPVRRDR